jgi:hypothetical protein
VAAVGGGHKGRSPGPGVVAVAAAFNFDDIGAEVGKDLSGPRAGQNPGKFEDAQSSQGARHDQLRKSRAAKAARGLTAQAPPLCLQGFNGYKALTSLLLQYRTIS